jgi:uncharacterized protein (TIGR03067 family)
MSTSGARLRAQNDGTKAKDSITNDLEEIQGDWKQIGYERDGVTEALDEKGWEPRVTFSGNSFVVTLADGSVPINGTFKLESDAATNHPWI